MMRRSRYGGYRGRSGANSWLRRIALVLFVLALLVGAALLFGQRYIIYTDKGLRLDLPFSQNRSEPDFSLSEQDVLIEQETSDEPDVSMEADALDDQYISLER